MTRGGTAKLATKAHDANKELGHKASRVFTRKFDSNEIGASRKAAKAGRGD